MPYRATQDERVMVESSSKCGSLEKAMENHFSILAVRNAWTEWKGQKDMILKDELPRSVGAHYATREEGKIAPERMKRLCQSRINAQL